MRRTATVTVPEGAKYERDTGKSFFLTEMPAQQAEDWAVRALGAMTRGAPELPPEFIGAGWGVIALVGFKAVLSAPWAEAKPLLDEMMTCVQRPMEAATRPLVETDIEEVATRAWLRDEVFRLHAGFSIAEVLSNAMTTSAQEEDQTTSDTETSPEQLEGWSPRDAQA